MGVRQEFLPDPANPKWCVAVEYLDSPGAAKDKDSRGSRAKRIDYKETLSPEDFSLFAKLRDWRKASAEHEGVPVYAIFTNEQLAKIATDRIATKSGLAELDGVGEGRVSKYSQAVIKIVKEAGPGPTGTGTGLTTATTTWAFALLCPQFTRPDGCRPIDQGRFLSGKHRRGFPGKHVQHLCRYW